MDEASKTRALRGEAFHERMFAGRVIDIGCGSDLVVPHAEPFDLPQGDAQHILRYREPATYDTVHASHCLEHMRDPPAALAEWWALVRPGGHLIVVVPEEDLYEQGGWPSLFNSDHKATFRLHRRTSWSLVSHDLGAMAAALPAAETISAELQDQGYDRSLMLSRIGWRNRLLWKLAKRRRRLTRMGDAWFDRLERRLGKPVDQTREAALAQIQVVVRKRA
jgi:SAM-dependent methyltransferase